MRCLTVLNISINSWLIDTLFLMMCIGEGDLFSQFTGLDKQNFSAKIVNIFLPIIFSICFGLIEVVLLSTHSICFG